MKITSIIDSDKYPVISVHVRNNKNKDIHILIFPTQDIPGIWAGHILDADIVTQGQSPGEALDMAIDACDIVPEESRERPAPKCYYDEHEMFRLK